MWGYMSTKGKLSTQRSHVETSGKGVLNIKLKHLWISRCFTISTGNILQRAITIVFPTVYYCKYELSSVFFGLDNDVTQSPKVPIEHNGLR